MKLYFSKGACSLVPRIIINELDLPCEYEAVDLAAKKTQDGKDYYAINPKGAVPALDIGHNEVLTENAVILQYLADKQKAYQLLPAMEDFKRYRVLEWLNYITTELHKTFGPLFSQKIPQEYKEQFLIPLLKTKFDFVNNYMKDRQYLIGDHFTLPDAYLFVMLRWALGMKLNLNDWLNLEKYYRELHKRPAIKKSLEQEGIKLI